MPQVWRQPVFTRRWNPDPSQAINAFPASLPDLVLSVLLSKDLFFAAPGQGPNYDWPNPKIPGRSVELLSFLHAVQQQLIGLDRFEAAPGQAPRFDWPNPRGYIGSVGLLMWLQGLIPLLSKDQFFGLAGSPNFHWPNPQGYPPVLPRGFDRAAQIQLVGLDQFFGLAGSPNYDWPNPKAPGRVPDGAPANLLSTLLGGAAPFYLLDWPNPQRSAGLIEFQAVRFVPQDQMFGAPGEVLAYDWPNPPPRRPPIDGLVGWSNNGMLVAPLPAPEMNFDQPNPRGPAWPTSVKGWTDQTKIELLGKDQFFGLAGSPNYDWPNPKAPGRSADLLSWLRAAQVQLIGQDQFFGLAGGSHIEWPVPRGAAPPPRFDPLDTLAILFTAPPAPPFTPADLPNPRSARTVAGWTWARFAGVDQLFGAPGEAPAYDWPNPRGAQGTIDLRTMLSANLAQLAFVPPVEPFYLLDWPNPASAAPWVRSWSDSFKLGLIRQDQLYGAAGEVPAYDWPNPRGSGQFVRPQDAPNQLADGLLQAPFVPLEWRNPQAAARLVESIARNGTAYLAAIAPFYAIDWPNPQAPRSAIDLRGWLHAVQSQLVDQFFGLAGNPNFDWPNPKIARTVPGLERGRFAGLPYPVLVDLLAAIELSSAVVGDAFDPAEFQLSVAGTVVADSAAPLGWLFNPFRFGRRRLRILSQSIDRGRY
jgi:hypothetical protein